MDTIKTVSNSRMLRTFIVHALVIIFIFGYETITISVMGYPLTLKGCFTFLLEVLTFYIILFWVVPSAFGNKRPWGFLYRLVLVSGFHLITRSAIAYNHDKDGFLAFMLSLQQLMLTGWRLGFILAISFIVGLFRQRAQKAEMLLKAEREKKRIENTLVQMRLNPHLLANGFSYIKAHTEQTAPRAADAILILARITRNSMIDVRKVEKMLLSKELELIQDYINFHQLLADNSLALEYGLKIGPAKEVAFIPPSLLITIVDNVLKYGVLNDPENPAKISIVLNEGTLFFKSWNLKRLNANSGAGLGMASVKEILKYYYKDKYVLHIDDAEDTYALTLMIAL